MNKTPILLRPTQTQTTVATPVLLFNDECGVCRHIAKWVQNTAKKRSGEPSIIVKPIGEEPDALERLSPGLSIWDAYATIHLLMPDGPLKLGGEAVAEVFRRLPKTQWFVWSFDLRIFGFRPFLKLLDLGYAILADVRPIFGCESCGTPKFWVRPFAWMIKTAKKILGKNRHVVPSPHLTLLPTLGEHSQTPRI